MEKMISARNLRRLMTLTGLTLALFLPALPAAGATSPAAKSAVPHSHHSHPKHKKTLDPLSAPVVLPASADLLTVFHDALTSDPTYQQAIFSHLATREGVPITLSALLPALSLTDNPTISHTRYMATPGFTPAGTTRTNTLSLTLSQTIFDFGDYAALASAKSLSHAANATLNAATQNLMLRTASAYFQVLQDEDALAYNQAARDAYAQTLDQVRQEYRVGLKTITDVYSARAAWQSSVATWTAAHAKLADDKEALRTITGKLYPELASLRKDFPLLTPSPDNIDRWVATTLAHNWTIRADQYNLISKRNLVREAFSGNLPSVALTGSWENTYSHGNGALAEESTNGRTKTTAAGVLVTLPLFAGGKTLAETRQAKDNYAVAQQQLESDLRTQSQLARKSFLGVVSEITQINADRDAIRSSISALQGLKEGYRVGTQTIVDVLNQQKLLLQAEMTYATDRYAYVNDLLALKEAAGTLSVEDLAAVNRWLGEK